MNNIDDLFTALVIWVPECGDRAGLWCSVRQKLDKYSEMKEGMFFYLFITITAK